MMNNRRMRMIAWVMIAIMLLCMIPLTASAGIQINAKPYAFVINNNAVSSYEIQDENGNPVDLKNLTDGQAYYLHLFVYKKGEALFPDEFFYYELPVEVVSATGGKDGPVAWEVVENDPRTLRFTWTGTKVDTFTVDIPVTLTKTYDLYNIVEINKKYYRLAKTRIKCNLNITGLGQLIGYSFADGDYEVNDYNFEALEINLNGKTYVYAGKDFVQDPDNPVPYYTVSDPKISVIKDKIGAMTDNKPNWLVEGSDRYDDNNKTTGFHRDYVVTLHDAPVLAPLYNFVGVNNSNNYYRLPVTEILAEPAENFTNNYKPKTTDYTAYPGTDYDFTNTVLIIDGVEYRYREKAPSASEKEYDNYYLVKYDGVRVKDKIHESGGDAWFNDPSGWLDGAQATYGSDVTNDTKAYHNDYKATTYKGKGTFYSVDMYDGDVKISTARIASGKYVDLEVPEKIGYTFVGWNTAKDGSGDNYDTADQAVTGNISLYAQWSENEDLLEIHAYSDWPDGQLAFVGAMIPLRAELIGFENKEYTLHWEYSADGINWIPIPDTNSLTYTYILDEQTANCKWRIVADDIRDKE